MTAAAAEIEERVADAKVRDAASLTKKKLDFSKAHCVGRRQEIDALLKIVQRKDVDDTTTSSTSTARAILIQAESGSGKSELLSAFRKELLLSEVKTARCSSSTSGSYLYCHGKCEARLAASRPFAALRQAMNELLVGLLQLESQQSPNNTLEVVNGLQEALGPDWGILASVLPNLKTLLVEAQRRRRQQPTAKEAEEEEPNNSRSITTSTSTMDDDSLLSAASAASICHYHLDDFRNMMHNMAQMEWRFERLRFAFRTLIRYATRHRPVILVLDDVHWADADTLQVLLTLLKDTTDTDVTALQDDNINNAREGERHHQANDEYDTTRGAGYHHGFTFIGACRPISDNKCQFSHLKKMVEQLQSTLIHVPLSNLSSQAIADICTALLLPESGEGDHLPEGENDWLEQEGEYKESPSEYQQQDQDLRQLATSVEEKAGGNAFVVLQYLRLLEQKGLLYYDDGCWKFDITRILQEDDSCNIQDNVKDVVAETIEGLDTDIRIALVVAASFGASQFDLATVVHAVPVLTANNQDHHDYDDDALSDPFVVQQLTRKLHSQVGSAVACGLIENVIDDGRQGQRQSFICSKFSYKFSHDRIREAAYSLLPSTSGAEEKEFHLKIGRQLRSWMDIQGELGAIASFSEETLLLNAVKQLINGKELITDSWEKLDLADLCFQAADLAAQQSSFACSMDYLREGIDCLPENAWQNHFDVRLKLTLALMRMQYTLARLDDCERTAREILVYAQTFKDKRFVFHLLALCLLQQKKTAAAIDLCFDVLSDELNVKIPRTMIAPRAIVGYMKISRRFRKMSDEEIVGMPAAADESVQAICDLFLQILDMAFVEASGDFVMYGIFLGSKMAEYLLEYGATPNSYVSLFAMSQISLVFEDFEIAERLDRLGTVFLQRYRKHDPSRAARWVGLSFMVNPLCGVQVNESVEPVKQAMREVWKRGTLDYVFMDCKVYLRHLFAAGQNLDAVLGECQLFSERLLDYKKTFHWLNNAPLHQAVLNFIGDSKSKDVTLLRGSHLKGDFEDEVSKHGKGRLGFALSQYHYYTMMLSYHFGKFRKAKSALKLLSCDIWGAGVAISVPNRLLYTGLVYIAMCRQSRGPKRIKYRHRARGALKRLTNWTQKGSVNCNYMKLLLEAEYQSLSGGKLAQVLLIYDEAVSAAKRCEVLHHIALANELALAFATLQGGDPNTAHKYLADAVHFYELWGSRAKVKDLQCRFNGLWSSGPRQSPEQSKVRTNEEVGSRQ